VAEVEGASAALLDALLQRLRGAVQLPECLRIVGHLRRLAVFPEAELRRKRAPPPGTRPRLRRPPRGQPRSAPSRVLHGRSGLDCLGGTPLALAPLSGSRQRCGVLRRSRGSSRARAPQCCEGLLAAGLRPGRRSARSVHAHAALLSLTGEHAAAASALLRPWTSAGPTLGCARFLQCREEWLAELVAELDERSVYDYLKRLTDVHRLQLFDVVMQYRAIFADDGPPADGAPAAGGGAGGADGGALYSWAEHRVCAPCPLHP